MVDTGWKHPQSVNQDSRRALNNNHDCYAFSNINNIKKNDMSRAEQLPWAKTGVDSDHKSPMIYAYNYGFNIPKDATVKKITLFALVSQLTHPKYYYEHYVLKRELRFTTSKFCNVKLKQGASLVDGGTGTQFSAKCVQPMLPYQEWSTEDTTTFSGTPTEWGITSKDIVSIINSNNFGVAVQFIGTIKNGWCNPGVAQLRMKIEYELPLPPEKPKSEFTKIKISHNGEELKFDKDGVSEKIIELTRNDYSNPAGLQFTYTHKGGSGETPYITMKSTSLIMGPTKSSYSEGKTSKNTYTLNKLQCGEDTKEKDYNQYVYIFPGVLVSGVLSNNGEYDPQTAQTVIITIDKKEYTVRFFVKNDFNEVDKARFIDYGATFMINNCLFWQNHVAGVGGAMYVTSEMFKSTGNIYGTEGNVNKADNVRNENNGKACPNTYWRGKCIKNSDDVVED